MAVEAQRQLATPAANPPEAGSAAAPAATTRPAASSSGALYRAGEPSTPTGGQFDRRM
jgi:hypothetical protein